VPTGGISSSSPPGRGFYDNMEIQIAVMGGSANVAEQAVAISKLAAAMRRNGIQEAPGIERLADRIQLRDLPPSLDGFPVIGVAEETLSPVTFDPHGSFIIAGPPGSGRTTALASISKSLLRWDPAAKLVYFGPSNSTLSGTLDWGEVALGLNEVTELAKKLTQEIENGAFADDMLAVVIEAMTEFMNTPADLAFQELAKAVLAHRKLLVVEGEPASLSGSWPLLQAVKVSRRGIALQPEQTEGPPLFKTTFPRVNRADFPEGRGLMVSGGRTQVVQIALPD
jgi:DNA segregation ATPase FtsK/SpoIIIE, S-DNA-T family